MKSLPLEDPARLLDDLDFVRSLARQLCHNEHAADDIAQATMTAAIEAPPQRAGNWRGWLATVARNLARKHYRTESRRTRRERDVEARRVAPSTAEVVAREEMRAKVVEVVLGLPEPYRKVVLLRHFNGLDIAACADALGIPQSTARTHLSRANDRMRRQLDALHEGDRKAWTAALLPFAMPTASTTSTAMASVSPTRRAVVALLAAASVTLAWFAWGPSDASPSPPIPQRSETASGESARADGAAAIDSSIAARDDGTDRAVRRDATVPAADPWTATGFVRDHEDNRGIEGASVVIWAIVDEAHAPEREVPVGSTRTGADGSFEIPLASLRGLLPVAQAHLMLQTRFDARGFEPHLGHVALQDVLAADDDDLLDIHLQRELLTKGRVVTVDGRPVGEARILVLSADGTSQYDAEIDGSFAVPPGSPSGAYSLLAVHHRHGRSELLTLRSDGRTESQTGDLVLRPTAAHIEVFVHYPNGQPVAGLDVSVFHDADEPFGMTDINGWQIDDLESWRIGQPRCQTDENGLFVCHNLEPGPYELDLDGHGVEKFEIHAGQARARIDVEYDNPRAPAQIGVRIEDGSGVWLPEAWYGYHRWMGAAAADARRRYEREGATPALLQTATEHVASFRGLDRYLDSRPDSFTIFESTLHDCGPAYAACTIPPGRHRADVRLVLQPPQASGAVAFDVRDASGAKLSPLWVRMTRSQTSCSMPIFVPGRDRDLPPPSAIIGPWHEVPASHRLFDLPAGPLTIEVLAGLDAANGRFRYPISTHTIEVPENGTGVVTARLHEGQPLVLDLRLPELAPDQRWRRGLVQIGLDPRDGRLTCTHNLQPSGDAERPPGGRLLAHSVGCITPGRYRFSYRPGFQLLEQVPGSDRWRPIDKKWRLIERDIEVRPGMDPIVVHVEAN